MDKRPRQSVCAGSQTRENFFTSQLIKFQFALAAILLALLCSNGVAAQTEILENQVKAAFLYKFPTYVEWPPSSFANTTSPVVFGILEADAMADELSLISRDNLLNGRTIVIKKLQPSDSTAGLNILFIGASQTRAAEPLLLEALSNSILTVTEAPAQRPNGSIINFAIMDDRVRFDVSLVMAEQAGLTVSSRLLQVARRVIEPNR
jgi:hypothetical protein